MPVMRTVVAAVLCSLIAVCFAHSQQQLPVQPGQPPVQVADPQAPPQQPPVPPGGFQLNPLQLGALDQVLNTWQIESGKITTFQCAFERWEYDNAFGPAPNIPLNKDRGELSYGKPDKGSFRITEIKTWQAKPLSPGQPPPPVLQGDWMLQPNAIGEHWVCDGKSVFEYRHDRKELVERPIPPQLQGQAIADGPLPFLFGADANKLKARYWMRVDPAQDPNQIWIVALPKFQAQAANFRAVEVILDRQRMLPTHMRVTLPNNNRHLYIFDIAGAAINRPWARVQNWFALPRLPLGWKRRVEQIPVEQAAQPAAVPR
jgi:TIGR03009 family protein